MCLRCGFSGHVAAFDFHHKYPKDKLYNITSGLNINYNDFENFIVPEAKNKCLLLCRNCHMIIHSDKKEAAEFYTKTDRIRQRTTARWDRVKELGLQI